MIIYLQMIESDEDKSKFEQLYIMYKGLMFHVAMKILKNEFDAEDAVHQAFLSLIENLKKISDVKCPKTRAYIVIITERKAIDIIRSRSKLVDMEFWESTYGIEIPLPGDHGLADAMARLPAAYRDILLLRYYNGYSVREISSMLHATEGSVSVNDCRLGKDLDFPESVGVMIESPAFIDEYTGQKNLELLAGLKQLISVSDIHNTLQAVGLDPNDKRTFKKYSLGMKQRLGIAAALMEKPDLLILDEPTNALDEQGVAMIAQLIRKECQRSALVVVACHDADFVQSVSDVVIQMQAGRVTSVIGK